MNELKPCPFCGGEAMKMTSTDGFTSIGCLECNPVFGVMVQAMNEAEAIKAWNTRAERTCHRVDVNGYSFRFECSLCGYVAIVQNCETRLDELPNFCPNCGAKVVE